jgi:hypothetical protein
MILQYANNETIQREEEAARRKEAEARQAMPIITGLAGHVQTCWQAARDAKEPIMRRMIECLRSRKGEYTPEELARIEEFGGGNAVFMKLTGEKCTAAESWLEDILFPPNDRPWGVDPTTVPDLSPEENEKFYKMLDEAAHERAVADVRERLSAAAEEQGGVLPPVHPMAIEQAVQLRKRELIAEHQQDVEGIREQLKAFVRKQAREADAQIEDVLRDEVEQSGWEDALREALPDIVGNLAGFVKGPIIKRKRTMAWGKNASGRSVPVIKMKLCKEFTSPSPFNIYPGPSSMDIDDGYLFEVHDLTRSNLQSLIGVDGYDEAAIRQVLSQYGRGGLRDWLWISYHQERERLEARPHADRDPEGKIQALQFWGSIMGKHLMEFGLEVEEPFAEYQAEIWMIGSYIIRAALNPDPLGKKPYFMAGFRKIPKSFWYEGLPEVIDDIQKACNAAARAALDNMALASGPQVGVDVGAIPSNQEITDIYPRKVWQFNLGANPTSGRTPIWFFQPQLVAPHLMTIYKQFSEEADSKSGVPKYSYGTGGTGGALGTATGMSMMMNAAARGIKRVVRGIDRGIVEPSIQRLWMHIMFYEQRPEFMAGDINVVARGSAALIAREQMQVRRNEFLQLASGGLAAQIVGARGIATILRDMVADLGYEADKVVPSESEIDAMLQQQNQQATIQQIVAQLQQMGIQLPAGGQTVDAAGQPVAGQDAAVFQQGGM